MAVPGRRFDALVVWARHLRIRPRRIHDHAKGHLPRPTSREPDETRPTSPPPRSASAGLRGRRRDWDRRARERRRGGAGAASSAIGKPQPASTSARIPRTPRTVPSPETCERPPKVRVRYALATPDDSGASLSATLQARRRDRRWRRRRRSPRCIVDGSAAAKSRAVAAASAPATPFVAHHGGSTVFHAIRAPRRARHRRRRRRRG